MTQGAELKGRHRAGAMAGCGGADVEKKNETKVDAEPMRERKRRKT